MLAFDLQPRGNWACPPLLKLGDGEKIPKFKLRLGYECKANLGYTKPRLRNKMCTWKETGDCKWQGGDGNRMKSKQGSDWRKGQPRWGVFSAEEGGSLGCLRRRRRRK